MLIFTLHLGCALLDSSGLPSREKRILCTTRQSTSPSYGHHWQQFQARPDESPVPLLRWALFGWTQALPTKRLPRS